MRRMRQDLSIRFQKVQQRKKAVPFICIREKKAQLPFLQNVIPTYPLSIQTNLWPADSDKFAAVKIPSGYTTIETQAFQNQTDLYQIEIPASVCIFFQWFNPASWLLKQELQNIHEYEADESVIREGVNARQYQLLLIKKAVGTRLYSMANSFNHSKLKKRITMMLKEKSNPWARLKYLYVLPLAAIAVTAFARPEISGKVDVISAVKVNDFVQIVGTKVPEKKVEVLKDTVKKDAPKEEALKMPFSIRNAGSQPQPLILVDGKEITGEQMQRDINPDMIESISVLKDSNLYPD